MTRFLLISYSILLATIFSACSHIEGVKPNTIPSQNINAQSIHVMVLGSYHFKSSNADVVSLDAGNVLTPAKQAELDAIAKAMLQFKPTVIVTERETLAPDYIDPVFKEFNADMLATNRNERVQLGYRIAKMASVTRVYGLDEQPSEGEPDYFPFTKLQAHAKKIGEGDAFDALIAELGSKAEATMNKTKHLTIAKRLIDVNTGFLSQPTFYYQLAQFDRGETQPAAELQAYWFMRNTKIFSKLINVTKPGDRVLVIYGAGHKFWLDHLVQQTPGFISVSPTPYLQRVQ